MDGLDVRIIRTMGFRAYENRPRDPNVLRLRAESRLVWRFVVAGRAG